MTSESPARQLARRVVDRLLAADPFSGTALGLRDYDALVPDASRAAEDSLAADLAGLGGKAAPLRHQGALVPDASRAVEDSLAADLAELGAEASVLTSADTADAVTI